MEKFEYLVEYTDVLQDAKSLGELGSEGWELCAVSDKLDIAIFKRPLVAAAV